MPAPLQTLIKTIVERLSGSKPSVLQALGVAVTAAVLTYRLLRSGS